jgi:hypothetical protein
MKATVKILFEFDETEIEVLMQRKGYEDFTKEDLSYELAKLDIEDLKYLSFYDTDDKEIIIEYTTSIWNRIYRKTLRLSK